MTTVSGPLVIFLEERVARGLGEDRQFFLNNPDRRYRVRKVLPDELGANQNASFAVWPNYVAVAVNRPLRARVLFACDLELRDDLTEADCKAIHSDLMELQAMFETSACGKVH